MAAAVARKSRLAHKSPTILAFAVLLLLALSACQRPSPSAESAAAVENGRLDVTPTLASTATPTPATTLFATASPAHSPTPLPSDNTIATPSEGTATAPDENTELEACGQILPILPRNVPPARFGEWDPLALAALESSVPDSARVALDRILAAPETVGLVAYRVGQVDEGVFLNGDLPMPLASVVKLIHLVAYVEAVTQGQLDPLEIIPLAEIERFYLPGLDLGAHPKAIGELDDMGRLEPGSLAVRLEELPWMMIRHSSNAAMDYLHMRLGQRLIEETAVDLGLSSQTAPCPFLGQFLSMSNHLQSARGTSLIQGYIEDPNGYGREAMFLTDAYSEDPAFRQAENSTRSRPSLPVQRLFSENLNPQGTSLQYASLMALIAQNGLSNGESSFLARRYLEWPMQFPANQELFSNLGYKNGSMPGILTTVYYAYPIGETTPTVVVLFFRDLPNRTYQQWRRNLLPHDELARWMLADPDAIPAMKALFSPD